MISDVFLITKLNVFIKHIDFQPKTMTPYVPLYGTSQPQPWYRSGGAHTAPYALATARKRCCDSILPCSPVSPARMHHGSARTTGQHEWADARTLQHTRPPETAPLKWGEQQEATIAPATNTLEPA